MSIRIVPISESFLTRAREQGVDDQGQPVLRLRSAEGGEPCRDVLRRARPGEEVLLASHSPFAKPGPYREYGPVFVLAEPTAEPVRLDSFPSPRGEATDYFTSHLALRAYDGAEHIVDAERVTPEEAPAVAERFLARPDVVFVDARFPVYGCFACRLARG